MLGWILNGWLVCTWVDYNESLVVLVWPLFLSHWDHSLCSSRVSPSISTVWRAMLGGSSQSRPSWWHGPPDQGSTPDKISTFKRWIQPQVCKIFPYEKVERFCQKCFLVTQELEAIFCPGTGHSEWCDLLHRETERGGLASTIVSPAHLDWATTSLQTDWGAIRGQGK